MEIMVEDAENLVNKNLETIVIAQSTIKSSSQSLYGSYCMFGFGVLVDKVSGENYRDSADLKKLDIPEKSTIELISQGWYPTVDSVHLVSRKEIVVHRNYRQMHLNP